MRKLFNNKRGLAPSAVEGFSLAELLVVIAIIGILAAATISSLNSGSAKAKSRNLERETELSVIVNAVYQYAVDNNGQFPGTIPLEPAAPGEICHTKSGEAPSCAGFVDLSVLTNNSAYLVEMPVDPQEGPGSGTGYTIVKTTNGRITVTATQAEAGATISQTR